jgi:hypothetical protein
MASNRPDKVYVAIPELDNTFKVYPAKPHQKSAYLAFMSYRGWQSISFNFDQSIKFIITRFNRFKNFPKFNDPQKYPRFCVLENENNQQYILSDDKESLDSFVALINDKDRVVQMEKNHNAAKKHLFNKMQMDGQYGGERKRRTTRKAKYTRTRK